MADDVKCACGDNDPCGSILPSCEEVVEKKKAKKVKLVAVSVIVATGETALVEWADKAGLLRRAYVPASEVQGDQVSSDTLDAGIRYGVDFEEILKPQVTAIRVAQELRRRGIWTAADVFEQPNVVIAALQAAYGLDLGALQSACAAEILPMEATK